MLRRRLRRGKHVEDGGMPYKTYRSVSEYAGGDGAISACIDLLALIPTFYKVLFDELGLCYRGNNQLDSVAVDANL